MEQVINDIPQLQMVAKPQVNVVTFRADPAAQWDPGAIYAFAHFMDLSGITVSAIKGDMLHFCVTGRFASRADSVQK
jgi:hypothetical protein